MNEVLPTKLWIGGTQDFLDPAKIINAGVSAVVDLAIEERLPSLPYDLISCRFPVNDGDGNSQVVLRLAVQTVLQLLEKEIPTLVCCSAGMSRSPTIVAFALAKFQRDSEDSVLRRLAKTMQMDIKMSLWNEVRSAVEQTS